MQPPPRTLFFEAISPTAPNKGSPSLRAYTMPIRGRGGEGGESAVANKESTPLSCALKLGFIEQPAEEGVSLAFSGQTSSVYYTVYRAARRCATHNAEGTQFLRGRKKGNNGLYSWEGFAKPFLHGGRTHSADPVPKKKSHSSDYPFEFGKGNNSIRLAP